MCTLALPKTPIKRIDSFRKALSMEGNNIIARKPPKPASKIVLKPKEEGGLGVINIEEQNKALLSKNLHKFFNRQEIPWVQLLWEKQYKNENLPKHVKKGSYWWRDNLKNLEQYKEMTAVETRCGSTILSGKTAGAGDGVQDLKSQAPQLFSFAKKKSISVQKALNQETFSQLFHLPLLIKCKMLHNLSEVQLGTFGSIIWEPISAHHRSTKPSYGTLRFMMFINGFGNVFVNLNTKCFFGFSSRIG
jgi:hypothetical protein